MSRIGDMAVDSLPEASYVQTHMYDSSDFGQALPQVGGIKSNLFNKPHNVGEMGLGDAQHDDPKGWYLHNALWSTSVTINAGAANTWWWDNYVVCDLLLVLWFLKKKIISLIGSI